MLESRNLVARGFEEKGEQGVGLKRGITPAVAALILIVISIAAVVVLYYWVSSSTTREGTERYARISVEAVEIRDGSIYVYVRNVGEVLVTASAIYVEDYATGKIPSATPEFNVVLKPGENKVLVINGSYSPKPERFFKITVSTKRGVRASYVVDPSLIKEGQIPLRNLKL